MKSILIELTSHRFNLWTAILLIPLILATGCSVMREIPLNEVSSEGTGKADVVTNDGYVYSFENVYVAGDSLIGSYTLVEERLYKDGGVAYEDVEYNTVLPLANISHLETKHFDFGNTLLVGAGATLFGIWVADISGLDIDGEDQGSGKYIEDPP